MRTHISIVLASLAAIAASTPALAQDNAAEFTGPRAELMAGYEHIQAEVPKTNENGIAWAGAVGYDVRVADNLIAGIDLEIGDSDNSRILGTNWQLDTGRTLYAGARLGFVASPQTLFYVKAGYANSEVRLEHIPTGNTWRAEELDGARLGTGIEQKLTDNLYVKAEYRFTNLEDQVSSHQAMAGAGIRF